MDALREQYEGGFKMSAYKDKTQGTWYVSFRYIDWTGKKTQKLKRGFKTKKEALNYEKEFIRKTAADMKMEMNSFIQVYFEDKKNELKENSIRNKQHMMNKHIVPYFGTRKMNEITPAEIIQWQNTIQERGYSKTYERMIQNQLNALFNHAQKIYNLKENPCKKVKKMGKSDANKLEFWTKAEYDSFIAGIEPESEDYLIFEILFWTGIREGELLALSLSDFDMSGNLLHGDYYLPDLEINEEEPAYGKYGIMRKQFLKEHRSARYQYLVLTGKLTEHLNQVDKEAREKVEILMEQMAEQWGVTEELKMQDQMEWVRRMNTIKNVAEENILKNGVYK